MDPSSPQNNGRSHRSTGNRSNGAGSTNWWQRLLIVSAVLVAVSATVAVAIASTRGAGDAPVGSDVALTRSARNLTGAGGSQEDSARTPDQVGSPLPERVYAVIAISEQPRLFAVPEASTTATTPRGGLAGRTITIDAGHASNPDLGEEATGPGSSETKVKDPGGTSGVETGQPEYTVNLALALILQQKLEAAGAQVVMTRSGDTFYGGNIERAQIANEAGSDLFVRIHCDGSASEGTHGASTLYPAPIPGWTDDIYASSRQAAQAVQAALVNATGALDNGAVERSDMTGFNWADVPAILVEVGFLTNPPEDRALASASYQESAAQGIFEGIREYLS